MSRVFFIALNVITVVAFLTYLIFFSESNIYKHRELNLKIKQLDENIKNTKNQINNIFTFEQLKEDTAGILEKYAREQLNLQRSNEDLFVVVYE